MHAWLSGVKQQHSISVPGVSGMCAGPLRVAVLDALLSCNVNIVSLMENLGQALCESVKGAKYERCPVCFLNLFMHGHQQIIGLSTEQHPLLLIKRYKD